MRQALRGTLHAVHAFVPIPVNAKPSELLNEGAAEKLVARARAAARARMTKALGDLRLGPRMRHLLDRHPVNAIPELARKIHADIVVMGAVSRTGLKRFFIGNTAERIVDDLTCDVLVVKPRGFESKLDRKGRGMRLVTTSMPMPY
ncbi:MAG: universal stress protein [Gammaproteobacteria bacterium]